MSSEKAPPAVDEALRGRVNQFYQAFISGKFRDAYMLVADDSQDSFMESSKLQYKTCETIKIDFTENFTKANVLESCLGIYRWHNANIPTKVPLTTHWKLVDGQWCWYYVKLTEVMTPWGRVVLPPDTPTGNETKTLVMPDPQEMARTILAKVKVDKTDIGLLGYESSRDELHIRNEMPGGISFYVDPVSLPGLKITPLQGNVKANEAVTVVFEYKLNDPTLCETCAKKTKPAITTQLHVQPTGQAFPVTITFAIPPELEKQIPQELRKQKTKK